MNYNPLADESRPTSSSKTVLPGHWQVMNPNAHKVPFTLPNDPLKDALELARRGRTAELEAIYPGKGGLTVAALSTPNKLGRTPLMVSCLTGKLETMLSIIDAGGDLESCDYSGKTVLFFAIAKRNIEAVRALISKGAEVSAVDNFGRTPLMQACMDGFLPAVKLLLRAKVKIGDKDNKG